MFNFKTIMVRMLVDFTHSICYLFIYFKLLVNYKNITRQVPMPRAGILRPLFSFRNLSIKPILSQRYIVFRRTQFTPTLARLVRSNDQRKLNAIELTNMSKATTISL